MSSSWFDDHSLKCPFIVAYPFLKVYTVEDFLCCCSPSAYLLFPLAVTNISSNPFFLMCPPYRVHYRRLSFTSLSYCHWSLCQPFLYHFNTYFDNLRNRLQWYSSIHKFICHFLFCLHCPFCFAFC